MISGYNTDVRYKQNVLHVQTEDKGSSNPVIETVVYLGGQVLIAERTEYGDLLEEGKGEAEIAERMESQHRGVIEAIKSGEHDERLVEQGVELVELEPERGLLESARDEEGPTLDQVILDYLTAEAEQDRLELDLDGGSDAIELGTSCEVNLTASSSKSGRPVSGAQVSVRMVSTVREPETLAEGVTGEDGSVVLSFELPVVENGSSAVIFSASSVLGAAEIKRVL